jgi:hypothetical protein
MAFLLVFSAGVQLERGDALLGLALGIALLAAEAVTTYGPFAVVVIPLAAVLWGIARLVRSRRDMTDQLQERTTELRAMRDERARLDVAAERLRLAGELDELLQHRLGALARMADAPPAGSGAATATLVAIEDESRRTLEDMRAIVGVLRDDGQAPSTDPLPTLAHLEAMLVRAKGANARLTVEGDPRVLPPGVELSAYRIVEHLLAALDDAPGVDVRVGFRDDALELVVSGPARRQAKEAIDRARERVALHSGTLAASTRGRRAETVVSLPVLAG